MEKNLVFRNQVGQPATSSLLVAETFGKMHKNVIQDIESLLVKAENLALTENQQVSEMFFKTEYETPLNNGTDAVKKNPMYFMNKDGFTLLVMGYTGQKAMEFKLKYINAFNKMEDQLKQGYQLQSEFIQQQTQLSQQIISVCDKLTSTVETMNDRLEFIEKRVLTVDKKKKPAKPKYLTISEAISVFAAKVRCIGKEDFYHCLRELEHLSKDEEDYNRPQGQYALTDMITAVNVKPNPEDADTEDQDFTLLITPGFLNIVIETVKWYEAYDMGYFSDLLVKDRPYCRK